MRKFLWAQLCLNKVSSEYPTRFLAVKKKRIRSDWLTIQINELINKFWTLRAETYLRYSGRILVFNHWTLDFKLWTLSWKNKMYCVNPKIKFCQTLYYAPGHRMYALELVLAESGKRGRRRLTILGWSSGDLCNLFYWLYKSVTTTNLQITLMKNTL